MLGVPQVPGGFVSQRRTVWGSRTESWAEARGHHDEGKKGLEAPPAKRLCFLLKMY